MAVNELEAAQEKFQAEKQLRKERDAQLRAKDRELKELQDAHGAALDRAAQADELEAAVAAGQAEAQALRQQIKDLGLALSRAEDKAARYDQIRSALR